MKEKMIIFENVNYLYKSNYEEKFIPAVKDVSFSINKGEFLAILGRNGSGKSTIAKMMNALIIPTEGTVLINGMDTSDSNNVWDIRSKAGMVFQNPDNQMVATIVEEDVAFGPENLGLSPEEIRHRVDSSLEIVGLSEYKKQSSSYLSGGQKQRLAIAGILAINPDIIIFDESTAMLDPNGRKEVLDTIYNLNKNQNKTIILITHYMEEVTSADRILVIDDGKIALEGTPKEIFSQFEVIKDFGLDVPQITELVYELNKNGFDIEKDIMDIDELVKKI